MKYMQRVLVVAWVAALSTCAAVQRNADPDGFQKSLAEARKHTAEQDPVIGTVPLSFSFLAPSFPAVGIPKPNSDDIEQRKQLAFSKATEKEVCFALYESLEWNDVGNLRDEDKPAFIASRRQRQESGAAYLESFDSLVDVPTRAVLPASGGHRLTIRDASLTAEYRDLRQKEFDSQGRLRNVRVAEEQMRYELCGPLPEVTPSTRYFTVALKFREAVLGEVYKHFLFVFAYQDADSLPSLDLRGTGAPRVPSSPSASPPGQPDQTPPGAQPASARPQNDSAPRASQMMSIERGVIASATSFTVKFNKPMKASPGEKFWITIVPATAGETEYTTYSYLAPDATSVELSTPAVSGTYEVRLHGNYPTRTYNVIDRLKFKATQGDSSAEPDLEDGPAAARLTPDKGAKSKMMSVAKMRIDAKANFTVAFPTRLKAKKGEKFWIAVAAPSSADADYISYQYIDDPTMKTIDLPAPESAGDYEVRLHGNYPTKKVNVVDRLKVTVK